MSDKISRSLLRNGRKWRLMCYDWTRLYFPPGQSNVASLIFFDSSLFWPLKTTCIYNYSGQNNCIYPDRVEVSEVVGSQSFLIKVDRSLIYCCHSRRAKKAEDELQRDAFKSKITISVETWAMPCIYSNTSQGSCKKGYCSFLLKYVRWSSNEREYFLHRADAKFENC